jgi:hypothetical protein
MQLDELERSLRLVLADQKRLAELLIAQRECMRQLKAGEIEKFGADVATIRQRIAASDGRRKLLTMTVARELGVSAKEPTLAMLIAAMKDPVRAARLAKLRDELRAAVMEVAAASHVAGRLAGAVLGHLNMAVRTLSGAINGGGSHAGGAYTRTGSPRVGGRIGVIEALG